MTKTELESKHLSDLHALAAEAGVPRYRMLPREELIEKLLNGGGDAPAPAPAPKRERPPRRRRERPARETAKPKAREPERESRPAAPEPSPSTPEPAPATSHSEPERPRRRRRRRRFGRKGKGLRVHDLLLPPRSRQALVYGESREACTALLRELAGELAGAANGPDPIALLVDPSPEELADWKREAPQAEIVAAGQARHASDALALAARRAEGGDDVILLVDSLSRFEQAFDDADAAKELFDAGLGLAGTGSGSLTVVAALEPQS